MISRNQKISAAVSRSGCRLLAPASGTQTGLYKIATGGSSPQGVCSSSSLAIRSHNALSRSSVLPVQSSLFSTATTANATEQGTQVILRARRSPGQTAPHFDKILVANRGEIACRVIRTAKKLGIRTVAVFSDVDRDSLHVKMADEAYCIGPAPSSQSYLRMDKIIDVCRHSGAQVCRYGFLSENAEFSRCLEAEGIVFIGPPASAIVSMGSKRYVSGYHGENQDPDFLFEQARRIGFPVLIKAVHGGGGKGMRTVHTPTAEAFKEALGSAKRESQKSFGNDTVLVEKYIERPRHVEVQVFADTLGNVVSLWERDCSVQRRNQKIIEESPAPGLSPELRAELSRTAVAAAKAVEYVGAGTVEFIFDNDTNEFYFMEMNTRLQVEHPVSEMVTGLDLVEWQLLVAAGNPLPLNQSSIPLVGHSFEVRIYAENPRNNFLPDSGALAYLSTPAPSHVFADTYSSSDLIYSPSDDYIPAAPSSSLNVVPAVRLEQGFAANSQIGVFYDPMIAKLIVHGRDRTEALRLLRKALDEYHVVGVSTNVEFLRTLAGHQSFIAGGVETGFIQKYFNELFPAMAEPPAEVFAKAALFLSLRAASKNVTQQLGEVRSPWETLGARRFGGDVHERVIVLKSDIPDSEPVTVRVRHAAPGHFDVRVVTNGEETQFPLVPAQLASATTLSVTLNDQLSETTVVVQVPPPHVPASMEPNAMERLHIWHNGQKRTVFVPPPSWKLSLGSDVLNAHKGALKAPMPSLVVDVCVQVGDLVEKNQAVVVLESMKTETVLRAHSTGIVRAVRCSKGEMVEEGKELVDIE
ncbi:hypothetical protein FISHEDRAFT_63666 [Fistulina hepatica ATCC 64428]|uniref:3-methylcrotonyl-CoA carboxylase n=1 Tax=Fistulina hepatica ATCC 64428 TaxID=1128425 RepID=A0A0D7APJ7_9AGAR|nr:hypothetical protein FISHEDRAFT_63666 [Fistulina hepatica ATCC 64428]